MNSLSNYTDEELLSELHLRRDEMSKKISDIDIVDIYDIIERRVAAHYRMPVSDISAPKKTSNVTMPRHISMFFAREFGETWTAVGLRYGKTHGTAIYASKSVKNILDTMPAFRRVIDTLRSDIQTDLS